MPWFGMPFMSPGQEMEWALFVKPRSLHGVSQHGHRLAGCLFIFLFQIWTCDSQVVGSSPGWAILHSSLGQATYTCVPLPPSSTIWYWPRGVTSLAGKVTAGLVESKGSLPPGLW